MQHFDASCPDATPSATLYNQVTRLGGAQLQAYLSCGMGTGQTGLKIYCVHAPAKFLTSLDSALMNWENLSFAFLGDLIQGHTTNVLFPNNAFNETNVQVYTLDYILTHLEELNANTLLFPQCFLMKITLKLYVHASSFICHRLMCPCF
jgi:hypothetical protein